MNSRQSVLTGIGVGLVAMAARAQAATLYVSGPGDTEIYQYQNAGYAGSTIGTTAANNFVAQSDAYGLTVDPDGNVIASIFNGTSGGAVAYSSGGTSLASSTFGNGNTHTTLFNGTLYTSSYNSGQSVVATPYTYSSAPFASFGTSTSLSTGANSGWHGFGVAVAPAGGALNTTSNNYLFMTIYLGGGGEALSAINLTNNTVALTGTLTPASPTGLAYDPYSGYLYTDNFSTSGALYQIVPQYANGTLSGYTQSQITLTGGGTGNLDEPDGLAIGPDGNLYVAEYGANEIDVINVGTGTTGTLDQLNKYIGGVTNPTDVAFSSPAPEPASLALLSLGTGGLLLRRRARLKA